MPQPRFMALRRGVLLVFVIAPLLATIYAMASLWNHMIGWRELALFVVLYVLTGIGVTFGYHRMLTHRSFDTGPVIKVVVLILAAMAVQGRAIDWAANHLKHHAFADEEGDPHSPLEGFFHAHIGWFFSAPPADRERYCKRHLADPLVVALDRTFLLWVVLGLVIPYLIGGWEGLLWGGLVRIAVVNHVTWSVNSVCHTYGDRPFDIKDQSRNNWIVGLLAFGEGWHHNHHAFPAMAYHGMTWRQFDLTGLTIRLLRRFGLVWNVKLPSQELIARRRRVPVVVAETGD
ncbi:MAG TPA: acyl-CoA desaturase [Thermomicrobiaceae bacterium]|nr:acyl-CoA desaturase [Thermomicrobiaceae bacterium]